MNADIKAKWVEALRSGKYRQGVGALKKECIDDGSLRYCCLGILCDIHDQSQWIDPMRTGARWSYGKYFLTGLPPKEVLDWSGLMAAQTKDFSDMNDSGKSFDEIADYIEANL